VDRSNPLHYDALTWGTIVYLAALGSVTAFSLYLWILKRIDVTVVSYQTFIIPILAVFLGWILLDESIAPRTGIGTALVLAGIAVTTRNKQGRDTS
jgi:drug/metabolite transporter (DMT)-like permease